MANHAINPDWWKALFDETYLLTDARSVCDADITGREVEMILDRLPLRPRDRILDLCGGHGRHSLELSHRGFHRCVVLDYSPDLLSRGREEAVTRGTPVAFVRGDARAIGFSSGSYDHVLILGNSLGYLPEPSADREIISEAGRVLRPGGRLLVDVADGRAVVSRFNPEAWHEIGEDIIVCRRRELGERSIRTREVVFSRQAGLIRDVSYCIRLFDPDHLKTVISDSGLSLVEPPAGFAPHEREGDFGHMQNRLIVTAHKP